MAPIFYPRALRQTIALLLWTILFAGTLWSQGPASEWSAYGGTGAGQRYSAASEINTRNVRDLHPAWTFHTHVFDQPSKSSNWRASFEATPVLWHGTLYFDTPFNELFALDAATGKRKWSYDPRVNREGGIYIVTSRGVSVWQAQHPRPGTCGAAAVIMATVDRRLIARDATTGKACPRFGQAGSIDLTQGLDFSAKALFEYTSAPTIAGDTIVLGSSVADNQQVFAASGAVRAFDAITGQQKWSWEPIRDEQAVRTHAVGSANAWSTISADPEHDLVFVPTGSASVDFYGGTRPGDDRDANSLVALRASTGERVWAFQFVHHDLWDYDTPSQPVLFTFRKKIPAVAVVTKTSMIFVFDRLTGRPLFPIEERPVPQSTLAGEKTSPTQPFSSLPTLTPLRFSATDLHLVKADEQRFCEDRLRLAQNDGVFTPPSTQGAIVYPGDLGGANWGSASFDPVTGVLYTRVSNMPYLVQELPRAPAKEPPVIMPPPEPGLKAAIHRLLADRPAPPPPPHTTSQPPVILGGTYLSPDSGGVQQREGSGQEGTPYWLSRAAFMTPGGTPCSPQPFGSIVATDLNTGKQLWSVPHGKSPSGELGSIGAGGTITTAGGLVFAASTNDGLLRAYATESGRELWASHLPAPANATPMTYEAGGRQFLVIAAGGHGFIGKGQGDAVIAYALPRHGERSHGTGWPR